MFKPRMQNLQNPYTHFEVSGIPYYCTLVPFAATFAASATEVD